MASMRAIFDDIRDERDRQDMKWGPQRHHPAYWLTILAEEFGEAAKEVLEHRPDLLRAELIQVAAVAVCWLQHLDSEA